MFGHNVVNRLPIVLKKIVQHFVNVNADVRPVVTTFRQFDETTQRFHHVMVKRNQRRLGLLLKRNLEVRVLQAVGVERKHETELLRFVRTTVWGGDADVDVTASLEPMTGTKTLVALLAKHNRKFRMRGLFE